MNPEKWKARMSGKKKYYCKIESFKNGCSPFFFQWSKMHLTSLFLLFLKKERRNKGKLVFWVLTSAILKNTLLLPCSFDCHCRWFYANNCKSQTSVELGSMEPKNLFNPKNWTVVSIFPWIYLCIVSQLCT